MLSNLYKHKLTHASNCRQSSEASWVNKKKRKMRPTHQMMSSSIRYQVEGSETPLLVHCNVNDPEIVDTFIRLVSTVVVSFLASWRRPAPKEFSGFNRSVINCDNWLCYCSRLLVEMRNELGNCLGYKKQTNKLPVLSSTFFSGSSCSVHVHCQTQLPNESPLVWH